MGPKCLMGVVVCLILPFFSMGQTPQVDHIGTCIMALHLPWHTASLHQKWKWEHEAPKCSRGITAAFQNKNISAFSWYISFFLFFAGNSKFSVEMFYDFFFIFIQFSMGKKTIFQSDEIITITSQLYSTCSSWSACINLQHWGERSCYSRITWP